MYPEMARLVLHHFYVITTIRLLREVAEGFVQHCERIVSCAPPSRSITNHADLYGFISTEHAPAFAGLPSNTASIRAPMTRAADVVPPRQNAQINWNWCLILLIRYTISRNM